MGQTVKNFNSTPMRETPETRIRGKNGVIPSDYIVVLGDFVAKDEKKYYVVNLKKPQSVSFVPKVKNNAVVSPYTKRKSSPVSKIISVVLLFFFIGKSLSFVYADEAPIDIPDFFEIILPTENASSSESIVEETFAVSEEAVVEFNEQNEFEFSLASSSSEIIFENEATSTEEATEENNLTLEEVKVDIQTEQGEINAEEKSQTEENSRRDEAVNLKDETIILNDESGLVSDKDQNSTDPNQEDAGILIEPDSGPFPEEGLSTAIEPVIPPEEPSELPENFFDKEIALLPHSDED